MGSKNRHGEEILNRILSNSIRGMRNYSKLRKITWIEPFVGGCNMIDKVGYLFPKRIGNDINVHLIEMFKAIQNGWEPPDFVSEVEYEELQLQYSKDIRTVVSESPLIAFVGFGCSFGAKWFGGYAKGLDANGNNRNYSKESKNNLLKQKDNLYGINFCSVDYKSLKIPENSIIYCDPPYLNTTGYKSDFNHNEFWNWCDTQMERGHKVFVSEYSAPNSWKSIWSKNVVSDFSNTRGANSKVEIENLYIKDVL